MAVFENNGSISHVCPGEEAVQPLLEPHPDKKSKMRFFCNFDTVFVLTIKHFQTISKCRPREESLAQTLIYKLAITLDV